MVRSTAAVVLAAGAGSRFAGPDHKLLAPLRGRPVVVWAVTAALDAGLAETIVVSGAVDLGPVLADHGLVDRVRVVVNPDWAQGQATSLAAGIAAVDAAGHDAAVVGLGDQPLVTAPAWRLVATQGLDRPMAVATYDGRRRNPVRLDRIVWSELPTQGDEGARGLLARRPDLVEEVPCPGESADVDTLEDLTRWS
jgi:molybdenum cofactor cytidylyltransferase